MNWQALEAIGSIIGSLAVLLTLVYLAVELKHSREERRASLLQHRSDASRQLFLTLATNPELTGALLEANRQLGAGAQPNEKLKELLDMDDVHIQMLTGLAMAHLYHRQTMFLSELSNEERATLDWQLKRLFGGGVYGVVFESVYGARDETGQNGFDTSFCDHVYHLIHENK